MKPAQLRRHLGSQGLVHSAEAVAHVSDSCSPPPLDPPFLADPADLACPYPKSISPQGRVPLALKTAALGTTLTKPYPHRSPSPWYGASPTQETSPGLQADEDYSHAFQHGEMETQQASRMEAPINLHVVSLSFTEPRARKRDVQAQTASRASQRPLEALAREERTTRPDEEGAFEMQTTGPECRLSTDLQQEAEANDAPEIDVSRGPPYLHRSCS
jgi:hypothetical protein